MAVKFSIIIPVYNVEAFLDECVESVINQTFDNFEIILVDDGSTDSSGKICDNWAEMSDKIKVVHQTNGGLSKARNVGIRKAQGEYLIFLDSDDFWRDATVLETIDRRVNHNNLDLLCFGYQEFDDKTKKFGKALFGEASIFNERENKKSVLYTALQKGVYVSSAWVKVLRRHFVIEHDLFFIENITSEDIDWSARILINLKSVRILPENLYVYRQRADSIVHTVKTKNLQMLADNIIRCVQLGKDISDKNCREIYWNYVSYQYCTFLIHACKNNKNEDVKKIIQEMKNFNWLLKYHLNKKVKMIYFLNLLGFKIMCTSMSIYGKKRI